MSVFNDYPDYQSRLKRLHRLIDNRGDYTANLTAWEQREYSELTAWYDEQHSRIYSPSITLPAAPSIPNQQQSEQ